jgi:predicted metal-dependent HD superfamily phosphohydrolase
MSRYDEDRVWDEVERVLYPLVRYGKYSDTRAAVAEVIEAYYQPHRVYHFIDHLANVLEELRRWRFRLTDRQYLTAFVALLLHDKVYNIPAKNRTNEELSATWAGWFIEECGIAHLIEQADVESAIRITEGHQPDDLVSLVVCWCDLAGFAKGDAVSKESSDKIRREYLKVYSPEEYAEGRRAFLTSYRDPFKVYPGASRRLIRKARRLNRKANRQLDRELKELSDG